MTPPDRLAVGFVDLCGFSSFTDANGDFAARHVVTILRRIVEHHARQLGVNRRAWTGDGCLLIATDAGVLSTCCRRILAEVDELLPLRARAGTAAGAVLRLDDDDVVGSVVNQAARCCAVAQPGTVKAVGPVPDSSDRVTSPTGVGPRTFATPVVRERRPHQRPPSARRCAGDVSPHN